MDGFNGAEEASLHQRVEVLRRYNRPKVWPISNTTTLSEVAFPGLKLLADISAVPRVPGKLEGLQDRMSNETMAP